MYTYSTENTFYSSNCLHDGGPKPVNKLFYCNCSQRVVFKLSIGF